MAKNSRTVTQANDKQDITTTLGGSSDSPAAPKGPSRPKRIPMGAGKNLDIDRRLLDEENYYYRFIMEKKDSPGRLAQSYQAGYEHVKDHNGNNITRPAGGGSVNYLMRLLKEYRMEDLEAKKQKVYNTLSKEAQLGDNEYAPTADGRREGGRSAKVRTDYQTVD